MASRIRLAIVMMICVAFGIVIMLVWRNRLDPVLTPLVTKNFAAIVGLPAAAGASFIVLTFFRQSESPIEFEALGIKMKGLQARLFFGF